MYLLDTNVVSELRRPYPDQSVLRWIADAAGHQIFVSAHPCVTALGDAGESQT